MSPEKYTTPSGIVVSRTISNVAFSRGLRGLLKKLDTQRGIYLSSGYEFPGRYSRWDIAAVAPPLEIVAKGRDVTIAALNPRGEALVQMLEPVLAPHPHWEHFSNQNSALIGRLKPLPALFPEEQRSKQPSAFSIVRALLQEFKHPLA
jgi:anthranilate synthase